ncbi:hypothetical protein [Fluviicola sp.]|uniref:hypothetical protein n=1 Tax=Fluviicola sp. TaxID=1917219 RepID=UPI003D271258
METLNPFNDWTTLQKTYFAIQVNKLITQIGNRGQRSATFNELISQLGVTKDQIQKIILLDFDEDVTTREYFKDFDIEDRIVILIVYVSILISEDSFNVSEFQTMVLMFDNVFGYPGFNTPIAVEAFLEDNPDVKLIFQSKMVRKTLHQESEPLFSKYNVIVLAVIVLAIIGLISIFT